MTINRRSAAVLPKILFLLFCLGAPVSLYAGTISGTVADPSGALIPGVRIEITGGELRESQPHNSFPAPSPEPTPTPSLPP